MCVCVCYSVTVCVCVYTSRKRGLHNSYDNGWFDYIFTRVSCGISAISLILGLDSFCWRSSVVPRRITHCTVTTTQKLTVKHPFKWLLYTTNRLPIGLGGSNQLVCLCKQAPHKMYTILLYNFYKQTPQPLASLHTQAMEHYGKPTQQYGHLSLPTQHTG